MKKQVWGFCRAGLLVVEKKVSGILLLVNGLAISP